MFPTPVRKVRKASLFHGRDISFGMYCHYLRWVLFHKHTDQQARSQVGRSSGSGSFSLNVGLCRVLVRACWIMQLRNPQACVTVPHPQLVHNVHAIRSHRRCGIVCSSAPPPPPPLPLACRLPLGMCCCTYALHVSLFPDFITGVELAVPGNPRQHPVPAEKGDTEDADGVENSPPFYQDLPFVPPPLSLIPDWWHPWLGSAVQQRTECRVSHTCGMCHRRPSRSE